MGLQKVHGPEGLVVGPLEPGYPVVKKKEKKCNILEGRPTVLFLLLKAKRKRRDMDVFAAAKRLTVAS